MLNRPKTVDSEAVHQAIEVNSANSGWTVSIELGILQSSEVSYLHKSTSSCPIVLHVIWMLQNSWFIKESSKTLYQDGRQKKTEKISSNS